nr:putative integron gene cassette protein [uncultured bacterium]
MIAISKRLWNLSVAQRLLIVLAAGIYLVVFRPWAELNPSISIGSYSGAIATLVLALLPRGLRLVSALGIAIAATFVVLIAGRVVLGA